MTGMIPLGELDAAADLTTAANIDRYSESQIAVDRRINVAVKPLVASAIADDDSVRLAAIAAMKDAAVIEGVSWSKGALAATDLNTLYNPGVYRLSGAAATGTSNLPPFTGPGAPIVFLTITNVTVSGNTYAVQEVARYGPYAERWWRVSRNTSGAWMGWARTLDSRLIPLDTGANVDDLRLTATYEVSTPTIAAGIQNLPIPNPGILEILTTSNGIVIQRYTTYGGAQAVHLRTSSNVTNGTLGSWTDITASPSTTGGNASNAALSHTDLLSRARTRRGGRIGTAGRGAIALRFDHHLDSFKTKILPLLQERNLPWTQVINPQNVGTGDDNMTWPEIQQMCLDSGGEVWNHGGDHANAMANAAIETQIVGALSTLETNLPALAIEGWAPPGIEAGGYGGAAPFATTTQNTRTFAGQLILENHAFVAGYAAGQYRILDPTVQPIGAPHVTIDQASPSSLTTALTAARDRKAGVAFMLHPNYLGESGYLSVANLIAFLDEIVRMRAADEIAVLSYAGLWVADQTLDYRHDLTPRSQSSKTVSANQVHTVTVPQYRMDQHFGATREISVNLNAASTGTVKIQVGTGPQTSHAVTTGDNTVHRYVTIPADASTDIIISVSATVGATITRVSALAV